MFQLHESTRRQLAFAIFFLLCMAPTTGVIGWAIAWRLPGHLASRREQIAQALGLDVTIASMRHLRPGVELFENVCLIDPETGGKLITCFSVEATASIEIDRRGEEHPALVLQAPRMTLDANQWSKISEVLQRHMQGSGGPELEIRLTTDELTLQSGAASQKLYRIEAGIGALPAGRQAGLQAQFFCCLSSNETAEKVRMRLVRNRQVSPPANGFEIDTGRAEFPCRLLALAYSQLHTLGADCRFAGTATLFQTTSGLAGELHGRLAALDLAGAIGQNVGQSISGQSISGQADVTLDQAVLRSGKLDAVAGSFSVRGGSISRALLQSAVDHLQLATASLAGSDEPVPFDMLSASFWLDQRGLSLSGNCPGVATATMTSHGQPMLGEPSRQPLPIGAVVQVFAGGANDSVPATQQALALARYLPTPEGDALARPTALRQTP